MNKKTFMIVLTVFVLLYLKYCFANEIKPCSNCTLERLITQFGHPILYEPIDYNFELFEKIYPEYAQKYIKNFSQTQMLELDSQILKLVINASSSNENDIAASYKVNNKEYVITYLDIDKMLSKRYNTIDNVSLFPIKEKYEILLNIIKTNLLYFEGILEKKSNVKILNEDEYTKSEIFKLAIQNKINEISDRYFKENKSISNEQIPDFYLLACDEILSNIKYRLETESVLLIKTIKDFNQYTGETNIILCKYDNDKVITLKDIKPFLETYLTKNMYFDNLNDELFIKLVFDKIFELMYGTILLNEKEKFKIIPYEEYKVSTIAQNVLDNFLSTINVSKEECENYYKENQNEFLFKEKIIFECFKFKLEDKNKIEKVLSNINNLDNFLNNLKNLNIKFENFEDYFYFGQAMSNIQKYLFMLNENQFSNIFEVTDDNKKLCILFYIKSKEKSKIASFDEVEKIVFKRTLAHKKQKLLNNYFEQLFKKYEVKINFKI